MNWTEYGMRLADTAKLKSKDPSKQVGCAILHVDNSVVSMGFNGLPMNVPEPEYIFANRDLKLQWIIHAELNAILLARKDLTHCTLYATLFPCSGCAKAIIQAGIERVVASPFVPLRWEDDCRTACDMFAQAGMEIEFYVGEGDETASGEGSEEPRCDLRREPSVPWDS
jgi:dCMP deaminase